MHVAAGRSAAAMHQLCWIFRITSHLHVSDYATVCFTLQVLKEGRHCVALHLVCRLRQAWRAGTQCTFVSQHLSQSVTIHLLKLSD